MATGKAASQQKASVRSLSKSLSSLSKTASSVASTAKAQGKDTTGITNAINKSNAMVAQTERQGSKSFSGSREEKEYNANVITPQSLTKETPFTTPTTPVPGYVPPVTAVSTPGLEALGTTVKDGMYVYDPTKSEAYNATAEANQTQGNALQTYLQQLQGIQPESGEAEYLKREKQAGIQRLQKEVNDYTSQINTIQKNSDAEALGLEGQGRGITESIIGGQQAQIRREAAIQALPIQAQLDAAQGNLTAATARLDKLWSIRQADITQQYNFKKGVYDAVYNFATTSQKNLLDARLNDIKTNDAKAAANIALAQEWSKMAVQTGQSGLISQFTALDPKSPTFAKDFGALQAKVVDPNVALDRQIKQAQLAKLTAPESVSAPDVKNFGTADNPNWGYIDPATNTFVPAGGLGSSSAQGVADAEKGLNQVNFLRGTITDAKELVGATGPNAITRGLGNIFVGNTQVKQLQNKIDTLKTNLLTLNSDPNLKKFFGPQMTEKDTELLMSAGSTLDAYSNSVQDNKDELERYDALLQKIQKSFSTAQAQPAQFGIVTAPDGMEIEIIPN